MLRVQYSPASRPGFRRAGVALFAARSSFEAVPVAIGVQCQLTTERPRILNVKLKGLNAKGLLPGLLTMNHPH